MLTDCTVVLQDQKIRILGGFKNINMAQEAIVSLILGSPPVSFKYSWKIGDY